MTDFCIQIHPHRSSELDLDGVRARCEGLANNSQLIRRFAFVDGTDRHDYANLIFETSDVGELWTLLQQRLYCSSEFGGALAESSMAMCEGQRGWEDYLLLHHYDPAVQLDRLPGA
jgi:hypothetical protein